MSFFNIVAATNEDTVVATYEPSKVRSDSYQSEAELEKEFIRLLCEQGYTYLPLHTEEELIANLRGQLEELNHYQFSDTEWQQFFSDVIANPNEHIPEKTRKIQEDNVQVLHRDDGSSKNITLIDKKNIHNNRLQVINQYEVKQADGARHDNRYDVTILVNGFPLVHVELKRRGVAIREAFNQINRYQRDSFWAGCGLYEYVQIFVISNGTNTKYYSNSTRYNAIKDAKHGKTKKEKTSNSFEFTSYWADANNRVLTDLIDFTRTFFAKHTILSVLTRYCIFTSEKMLMVMRPYQITATERILNRIEIANNYKKYGTIEGGGYIWHTTGSGKTLTSFKTARLASQLPYIDKVLFVVDRKDLDYQTMTLFHDTVLFYATLPPVFTVCPALEAHLSFRCTCPQFFILSAYTALTQQAFPIPFAIFFLDKLVLIVPHDFRNISDVRYHSCFVNYPTGTVHENHIFVLCLNFFLHFTQKLFQLLS